MENDNSAANILLGFFAVGVVLFVVFGLKPLLVAIRARRHLVQDYQKALLIRDGKVVRVLEPGSYSTLFTDDRVELHDLREQAIAQATQELVTADRLTVKASLYARFQVQDPLALRQSTRSGGTIVYDALQQMLRARIAGLTLEQILDDRSRIVLDAREDLSARIAPFGLVALEVELREFILSGPTRQAYADLWKAEKDAKIALEKARGEQASLRALANAARMLKGNPELMNLRLLQALAGAQGKPGPTIVLGGGTGLQPVGATATPATPEDDA